MKRIKTEKGSARVSEDIPKETEQSLNKMTKLAYEQQQKTLNIGVVSESFDSDEVDCKHYVYEYGFEDNDEYCKKGWDINYCSFCKHNKAKGKYNSR